MKKLLSYGCRGLFILLCCLGLSSVAHAQTVPQQIGVTNGIVDEFGEALLPGTNPSSPSFGFPYIEGDLVQVLQADSGLFPPNSDGTPSFANPVLFQTRIGRGVIPNVLISGRFSDAVVPRPTGNIFIRVFNAPSLSNASFYADSQIHTMVSGNDAIFHANILQTAWPLDPADDDGDGLNNSWEKSYGTNPNIADSDGDDVNDGDEIDAGTDPLDAGTHFMLADMWPSGSDLVIQWKASAGRTYVIECALGDIAASHAYEVVGGPVVAAGSNVQQTVANGLQGGHACFRIRMTD